MQQFTIHTPESAPDGSRLALDALKEQVGFVPNLAATMAESPAFIGAFTHLRAVYQQATLTAIERELILLAAAVQCRNAYGVAVHSTVAKALGVDPETIASLRAGDNPSSQRLSLLTRIVRGTLEDGGLGEAEVEAFVLEGVSKSEVLDTLTGATIGRLVAWMYRAAPQTPLDAAFKEFAWVPAAAL